MSRQYWTGGVGMAAALLLGGTGAMSADLGMPKELPVAASAASVPVDFIFGARFQSDYNFRGISQSNRDPSTQSYFELQLFDNLLYAGFATYKVDLPTRPATEFDITGGIRPKLGPFAFDLGFIYYHYPNERQLLDVANGNLPLSVRDTDMVEVAGKVAYTYADVLTVGANVFHAPNWLGSGSPGTYVSGTAKYLFPENALGIPGQFAVSGEYGHYFFGTTGAVLGNIRLPDYNYGNVGMSYTYGVATLDVRFHDTDLSKRECFTLTGDPRGFARGSGRSNWCGDAVIATLSVDLVGSKVAGIFAPAAVAPPAPSERGAPPRARDATGQAIR